MPTSAFAPPRKTITAVPGPQALTWITTLTARPLTASLIWANISKYEFSSYYLFFNALQNYAGVSVRVEGSHDGGANYSSLWNGSYQTGTGTPVGLTTEAVSAVHIINDNVADTGVSAPYTSYGGLSGICTLTFSPIAGQTEQNNQVLDPAMFGGLTYAFNSIASRVYAKANAAVYLTTVVGTQLNTLRFTASGGNFQRGSIAIYGVQI